MTPSEYAEQYVKPPQSTRTADNNAAVAAIFIRAQMVNHVRERLGESPSNADSNVNASWLALMGGIVWTLEHK